METIIKYLQNPMKIGVYNYKLTVDFSDIFDFFNKLMEKRNKSYEKAKGRKRVLKSIFERQSTRLSEAFEQLKEQSLDEEELFESLVRTFRAFARLDEFPKDLGSKFYVERDTIRLVSGKATPVKRKSLKFPPPAIFHSRVLGEIGDVLSIERKYINKGKWLFDVVTIKKKGVLDFKKCLQSIPQIKKGMTHLKERKQFSTRYTFRPYPLAVKLWLNDGVSIAVPSDLRSFLHGAIRYIFRGEWRTSIVLSAISVESVLADLYEETHKTPAPDTPLGDLFQQIREKIDFPPEIAGAINMTNKARIAAVHRSRFPVSDREAINALYGATNFISWYVSKF